MKSFIKKILQKIKYKNSIIYKSKDGIDLIYKYIQQQNNDKYTLYILDINNKIVLVKIDNKEKSISYAQNDFQIKTYQVNGKEQQFMHKVESLNSAFNLKG